MSWMMRCVPGTRPRHRDVPRGRCPGARYATASRAAVRRIASPHPLRTESATPLRWGRKERAIRSVQRVENTRAAGRPYTQEDETPSATASPGWSPLRAGGAVGDQVGAHAQTHRSIDHARPHPRLRQREVLYRAARVGRYLEPVLGVPQRQRRTVGMRGVIVDTVDTPSSHGLILVDRPRPRLGARARIVAGGQRRQRTDAHRRALPAQVEHGDRGGRSQQRHPVARAHRRRREIPEDLTERRGQVAGDVQHRPPVRTRPRRTVGGRQMRVQSVQRPEVPVGGSVRGVRGRVVDAAPAPRVAGARFAPPPDPCSSAMQRSRRCGKWGYHAAAVPASAARTTSSMRPAASASAGVAPSRSGFTFRAHSVKDTAPPGNTRLTWARPGTKPCSASASNCHDGSRHSRPFFTPIKSPALRRSRTACSDTSSSSAASGRVRDSATTARRARYCRRRFSNAACLRSAGDGPRPHNPASSPSPSSPTTPSTKLSRSASGTLPSTSFNTAEKPAAPGAEVVVPAAPDAGGVVRGVDVRDFVPAARPLSFVRAVEADPMFVRPVRFVLISPGYASEQDKQEKKAKEGTASARRCGCASTSLEFLWGRIRDRRTTRTCRGTMTLLAALRRHFQLHARTARSRLFLPR
ncbi:hypothetical protein RHRU231_230107 [Rhodococcus ruber]|uniref:Uncharacterized protein n=1 Tax=Rhodococcus ruber TaxID=1830 RepID=A0A098BEY7_9NOCA|nr:hypothetical protein RHRU231_230107 [Rhodococcus ruber]